MSQEETEIRAVIRTYFEGMHEASAEKTRAVFRPEARITGYLPDGLASLDVEAFAGLCARVQPSPAARGDAERLDVLSVEIAGATAVARVRDDYDGNTFLDTLTLLRDADGWRIHDKLFHVEGPAG